MEQYLESLSNEDLLQLAKDSEAQTYPLDSPVRKLIESEDMDFIFGYMNLRSKLLIEMTKRLDVMVWGV